MSFNSFNLRPVFGHFSISASIVAMQAYNGALLFYKALFDLEKEPLLSRQSQRRLHRLGF